jgi:hypothetical protein
MLARQIQEAWTGVNTDVLRSSAGDDRGKHTLPCPDVEYAFSWP